ncbi:MAG TPA: hypothetical protein VMD92_03355 [Acidobacteriaceae bacterium]|jgi:hypothetical protein|nr:hypothetical protein [Acidobacteriaceae bacterium]
MQGRVAALICTSLLACATCAQQTQPTRPIFPAQDGGMRTVLESIVVPPIPNAPFTATLATEWARPAGDGATITLVNQRQLARDANGRLYEQRWLLVPKGGNVRSRMNWIQIADPNQRMLYNCNVATQVCDLLTWNAAPDLAAATPPPPMNGPLRGNRGTIETESLGTRIIAGIETTGTRVTTVWNAGVMGNDAPVTQVRETWRSAPLAVNLLSIRSGPLIGTQTFTVTELDPNPPDPSLFEVPAGFAVRDQRETRPPSN